MSARGNAESTREQSVELSYVDKGQIKAVKSVQYRQASLTLI